MNDLIGFFVYGAAVWAALTLFDELQNRRRIDAWKQRAEHIKQMRGTP